MAAGAAGSAPVTVCVVTVVTGVAVVVLEVEVGAVLWVAALATESLPLPTVLLPGAALTGAVAESPPPPPQPASARANATGHPMRNNAFRCRSSGIRWHPSIP